MKITLDSLFISEEQNKSLGNNSDRKKFRFISLFSNVSGKWVNKKQEAINMGRQHAEIILELFNKRG